MTSPEREDVLARAAFEELKADDSRAPASFHEVLERPAPSTRMSFISPILRLAAAGLVIAASAVTYQAVVARRHKLEVPNDVVSLGAWRPVTDALMPTPTDLIRATPTLGGSMLDSLTTGALP